MKRIRIVNKSKDGVKLSLAPNVIKSFAWEEFNKNFLVVDSVWAELNENGKKTMEQVNDLISSAVASYFVANKTTDPKVKITNIMLIGQSTRLLSEKLECTLLEAVSLVKDRVNGVIRLSVRNQRKNIANHKEKREEQTPKAATFALGDIPELKELKDKMQDENKNNKRYGREKIH